MVSVFMVHPNLHLTKCDTSSVDQIHQYQSHLMTSLNSENQQLIEAEIQYLTSYSKILKIMHKYFSKPILTFEDESKGLDLIESEMGKFTEAEKKLKILKCSNISKCSPRNLDVISEE